MNFLIWGSGERGTRLLKHLGKKRIIAFIDSDEEKVGLENNGVKIISYKQYLENYKDKCIIIATHEGEVVNLLMQENITNFLRLSECPDEFNSPNIMLFDYLKAYIISYVNTETKYIVLGETLFGILVYEWLSEFCTNNLPYLCVTEDIDRCLYCDLKENYGEDNVIKATQVEPDDGSEILYALPEYYDLDKKFQKFKLKKILRLSEEIPEYRNKKIEAFHNKHRNQRCFIVATGPSLSMEDLELLHKRNEICISLNSIYKIFEFTSWRPNYYVAQDYRVMRDERVVLQYLDGIDAFISDGYQPFCEEKHEKNIFIHHGAVLFPEKGEVPFSEDIAQLCYQVGTVTYSCIQIAAYMGFSEIYLLGVDFSGFGQKDVLYAHCYKEDKMEARCDSERCVAAYTAAKKYADEHGIQIKNATRGGKLEIFERIEFDSLFDEM